MNLYNCWYHGVPGQCSRLPQGRWLFVPAANQIDNRSYRNIQLSDLVFRNKSEYKHELGEYRSTITGALDWFLQLPEFLASPAVTVGGRLLMPGQK